MPAEPPDRTAYLDRLAALARELAAELRGAAGRTALLALALRLDEWIEDTRSVGHDDLADAVAEPVRRLRAAITAGRAASDGLVIADELAKLAASPPSPPAGTPKRAFWK